MRAAALLVFLLALPLSYAATDVAFLVNGEPLSYVLPGAHVEGELVFTKTPGATYAQALSENIVGPTQGGVRLGLTQCTDCGAPITLVLAERVDFTFQETVGNEIRTTPATIVFQVDAVKPVISDVRIGECSTGCAYGPNQRELTFAASDPQSGLARVRIGGQDATCEEALRRQVCAFTIEGSRDQTVTITATDRAGNSAEHVLELIHDDTKPRIIDGPRFLEYGSAVPGGQEARLYLVVSDASGVRARIQTPVGEAEATCAPEEGQIVCNVPFRPDNTPYNGNAQVIVIDGAGNNVSRTIPLQVLQTNMEANPDLWEVEARTERVIDQFTWLSPTHVPVTLKLVPRQGTPSGAQPVRIDMQCNHPALSSIASARIAAGRTANVDLTIGNPENRHVADPESTLYEQDIICNVRINSRIGGVAFNRAEEKEVRIPLTFTGRVPAPREALELERTTTNTDVQIRHQQLATRERTMALFQSICATAQTTQRSALALGAVGLAMPNDAMAQPLNQASTFMHEAADTISSQFEPLCRLMACDLLDHPVSDFMSDVLPAQDATGPLAGPREYAGQALTALDMHNAESLFDPYRSKTAAVMMGCIPAVYYHERVQLDVKCDYSACLNDARTTGFSISECQGEMQFQDCRLTKREAFFAYPHNVLIDTAANKVDRLVSDPASFIGLGSALACRGVGGAKLQIGCKIVGYSDRIAQMTGLMQDLERTSEHFNTLIGANTGSACQLAQRAVETFESPRPVRVSDAYCNGGFITVPIARGQNVYQINGQIYITGETRESEAEMAENAESHLVSERVRSARRDELSNDAARELDRAVQNCEQASGSQAVSLTAARGHAVDAQEKQNVMKDAAEALAVDQRILADQQSMKPSVPGYFNDRDGFDDELYSEYMDHFADACSTGQCDERRVQQIERALEREIQEREPFCRGAETCPTLEIARESMRTARENYANTVAVHIRKVETSETVLENAENAHRIALKAAKQAAEQARIDALRAELTGPWHIASRRYIRTAMAFSNFNHFAADIIGRPIFKGWSVPVTSDLANRAEIYVHEQCKELTTPVPYAAAYHEAGGAVGAKISAASSSQPAGSGVEYVYRIDTYVNVPEPSNGTVTVILRNPSEKTTNHTISLRRGKANTFSLTDSMRYGEVCLEFPDSVQTYFGAVRGSSGQGTRICTRIQEAIA